MASWFGAVFISQRTRLDDDREVKTDGVAALGMGSFMAALERRDGSKGILECSGRRRVIVVTDHLRIELER